MSSQRFSGGRQTRPRRRNSWQITAQDKAEAAHKGMIHSAKIMGATARMLLPDMDLLAQAKQDHRLRMEIEPYVCPIPEDVTPPLFNAPPPEAGPLTGIRVFRGQR
ncbi:MAG TPA: hypothetical protein DIU10_16265 [Sulfitobacter sp.]|nr:hypothetical protein [Sulfitobacter sp.]|tara:strand:- start:481 stop:798 length:318 start_codon:yes stop_codon:yes gene_type:complete